MGKQLVVIAGLERGRVLSLDETDILQLGCSQTLEVNCRLRDPRVARVHCEIQVAGDRVTVIDADTSNGTFLNGERITQQELHPGDVLRIGETEMRYLCDAARLPSDSSGEIKFGSAENAVPGAPPPLPPWDALKRLLPPAEVLSKLVGKTFGHFKIEVQLGVGYWGRVFRARDTRADHSVALKVLRPEFGENEETLQHFSKALKAVLPLRHPNLLVHFGAGKAGAFAWIAMEYIEGRSLTQVIRRAASAGLFDWRQAYRVAVHLGRALEHAHQQRVFHGSVTPQNILIRDSDKQTKLCDLMLAHTLVARRIEPLSCASQQEEDLAYLAPERLREAADSEGRSDLYSLGATVYALLTGQPPFQGKSRGPLIKRICTNQLIPARPSHCQPSIPDALDRAVMKLLNKLPEDRYVTPAELLADLAPIAKTFGIIM